MPLSRFRRHAAAAITIFMLACRLFGFDSWLHFRLAAFSAFHCRRFRIFDFSAAAIFIHLIFRYFHLRFRFRLSISWWYRFHFAADYISFHWAIRRRQRHALFSPLLRRHRCSFRAAANDTPGHWLLYGHAIADADWYAIDYVTPAASWWLAIHFAIFIFDIVFSPDAIILLRHWATVDIISPFHFIDTFFTMPPLFQMMLLIRQRDAISFQRLDASFRLLMIFELAGHFHDYVSPYYWFRID